MDTKDWYSTWQDSTKTTWEPTKLSKSDEKEFEAWIQDLPWYENMKRSLPKSEQKYLLEDITSANSGYDYRKAWLNGIKPLMYQYDNTYHWPSSTDSGDMLKSPNHPTAWMEYFMRDSNGIDPNQFGLQTPENARTWLNQFNSVLNNYTR